jgi:outer membrane protein OmpA-like peptidoglycan-associated protein
LGQVQAPAVVPAVPKSVVVTTLVCESGNGIDLEHRDAVKSPRNAAGLAERSTDQNAGCKPWTPWPQVAQPATPAAAPSLALPAVTTGMVDVLTAVHNLKTPTLLFDFDSAVLSVKGKNYLDLLSKILRSAPGNIDRIEIKGHTDSIGPPAVNQALSLNRANAVRNYLSRQGVKNAMLTKGLADKEPLQICADRDGACRQNQRRVEIKVFFSTGKPENFSQLQSK